MKITEQLESDFKQALKNKDKIAVSTLRMLKAAIHNKEIEQRSNNLSDAEVIKVITKQVQQHRDSIEQFKKGNRDELVEKETKEMEILKGYLPEQLSEQEIAKVVKEIIAQTDTQDKSGFGKVMKLTMAKLQGRADGGLVKQIVSHQFNPEKEE